MNFLVKALPTDECNPEFAPDKALQDGVECAGYLLVPFDAEGDPISVGMNHISIENLAKVIRLDDDLAQAAAIASGYIEGMRRKREYEQKELMRNLAGARSLHDLLSGSDSEEVQ